MAHAIEARTARAENLPGYALFAGLLAMAGLPIYIHAPKFYVDEYGVSLGALGAALFVLRLVDFVQDPVLGWLTEATRSVRSLAVGLATGVMALAMLGLFAVTPLMAPLIWFGLTLTALFSAFSFLTITFYAQGIHKAAALDGTDGEAGHVRLAAWRETGALLGVSLAATAPTVLALVTGAPFVAFALVFGVAALGALVAMRGEWVSAPTTAPVGFSGFGVVLRDGLSRRLLLIALLNATPVAVTSTLFLFFVESRLAAPGLEGPLLLLFFLAAAGSAPLWGRAAMRFGAKPALLAGMGLAIVSFGFAATLGAGDVAAFAVICLASGAALGADLTLLPAIFARRMARIAPGGGAGFGLWAFVTKASLALAAIVLLPVLQVSGFRSGTTNPETALIVLSLFYAALPCALKLVAMVLLATTPLTES